MILRKNRILEGLNHSNFASTIYKGHENVASYTKFVSLESIFYSDDKDLSEISAKEKIQIYTIFFFSLQACRSVIRLQNSNQNFEHHERQINWISQTFSKLLYSIELFACWIFFFSLSLLDSLELGRTY